MRRPVEASFWLREDGGVTIFAALILAVVVAFSALTLDSGLAFDQKRRLQTATDMAAMAAVLAPAGRAGAAATAAVLSNGYAAADVALVEPGAYVADAAVSANSRFTPGGAAPGNAVRVTMRRAHPYVFGGLLAMMGGGAADPAIVTRSVASTRAMAAFSLGSGLATLNNGIANSLLSALAGSRVSLSLMDYQSLAGASVDLMTFSSNLATRADLRGTTYATLAASTVKLPAAVAALADSVAATPAAAPALALLGAVQASGGLVTLGKLIDFGPNGTLTVGESGLVTAKVDALRLASALLQLANGQHQLQTSLSAGLPGILSASLTLAVGEAPTSASLFGIGPAGGRLSTAQTRLSLMLQLAGPPFAPLMTLPLTLNLAPATATLNAVSCTGGIPASTVSVAVTPGLADAWTGAAAPAPATLVDSLLLRVTAKGRATIANTQPTMLGFSSSDIAARTAKSTSTTSFVSPLVSSLFNSLQINVTVLGVLNATDLNGTLLASLAGEVAPIDTLVSTLLQVLGLSLGNATAWVSDAQCGRPVLVH